MRGSDLFNGIRSIHCDAKEGCVKENNDTEMVGPITAMPASTPPVHSDRTDISVTRNQILLPAMFAFFRPVNQTLGVLSRRHV